MKLDAVYDRLVSLIQRSLDDSLRKLKYRGHPNQLRGHCYVACEAMFHLRPELKPHVVRFLKDTHWFLKTPEGKIIDPTAGQFNRTVGYRRGRPCGFLTKTPSKRCRALFDRMKVKIA